MCGRSVLGKDGSAALGLEAQATPPPERPQRPASPCSTGAVFASAGFGDLSLQPRGASWLRIALLHSGSSLLPSSSGLLVWLISSILGTHENEPTFAQKSGPADWRAPTVSCVVVLVANESWALAPCQDRSRRRRWPKASLYRGPAPNQTRPPT